MKRWAGSDGVQETRCALSRRPSGSSSQRTMPDGSGRNEEAGTASIQLGDMASTGDRRRRSRPDSKEDGEERDHR